MERAAALRGATLTVLPECNELGQRTKPDPPPTAPPARPGRPRRPAATLPPMTSAQAYIVGAYEHPTRKAPDKSVAQLHAESALGALADAGLRRADVDGYFCAGDAPGLGPLAMADYLNLRVRHLDSTDLGGCSYIAHVAHAAEAIAAGKCNVALITLAGRPRSAGHSGTAPRPVNPDVPDAPGRRRSGR